MHVGFGWYSLVLNSPADINPIPRKRTLYLNSPGQRRAVTGGQVAAVELHAQESVRPASMESIVAEYQQGRCSVARPSIAHASLSHRRLRSTKLLPVHDRKAKDPGQRRVWLLANASTKLSPFTNAFLRLSPFTDLCLPYDGDYIALLPLLSIA